MLRTVSAFYLISMLLAFAISLWLAAYNIHPAKIMTMAMMAWPMSALVLLARRALREIRGTAA